MQYPCITDIAVQDIGEFCQTTRLSFLKGYDTSKNDTEYPGVLNVFDDEYTYNVSRLITFSGERYKDLADILMRFMYEGFNAVAPRDRYGLFTENREPVCEVTMICNNEIICMNGENQEPHPEVTGIVTNGSSIYSNDFNNLFYVYGRVILLDVHEVLMMCINMYPHTPEGYKDLMEFVELVIKYLMARNQVFVLYSPKVKAFSESNRLMEFLQSHGDVYEFRDECIGASPLFIKNVTFKKM